MGIIDMQNWCSWHLLNGWFYKDFCFTRNFRKFSLNRTFGWECNDTPSLRDTLADLSNYHATKFQPEFGLCRKSTQWEPNSNHHIQKYTVGLRRCWSRTCDRHFSDKIGDFVNSTFIVNMRIILDLSFFHFQIWMADLKSVTPKTDE